MVIKRTEFFDETEHVTYLQDDGFWGKKETAKIYYSREKAEDRIDLEESDPVYEKCFMGRCEFDVEA